MRTGTVIIPLTLLLLGLCDVARAELIMWDDLLKAADQAGKDLADGKDRKAVLDQLNQALEKNPGSPYLGLAGELSKDLSKSLERAANTPETKGAIPLMETTLPIHLVAYSANWGPPLDLFMKKHTRDPMTAILSMDRSAIESLLPQLRNQSPTRSYCYWGLRGVPKIPRVCDMALLAIEFHSKCRFHFNASTGRLFHELPIEDRIKTRQHIEKWWAENKRKSTSAGIRSQLPHADFYAKVWMAKNLANLADDEGKSDREYAIEVLRTLVRENWGHPAAHAANALAEFDDFSPVEVFYTRWKQSLGKPGKIYDSYVVFYLTHYGTRREWELLHKLAQREIDQGLDAGIARIWPALVNCSKASSSPLAIPGLALALTQTKISGSRSVKGTSSQPFSYADTAVEHLQKLTGVDFGYRRNGSAEERSVAIQKAQKWWRTEGSKKFTFDYFETMIDERANKNMNHDG